MSKRQAGIQITREREEEEWDRDGETDAAETATAEVLATRKFAPLKSRRKPATEETEEKKVFNPFAFGVTSADANKEPLNKPNPFAAVVTTSNAESPQSSSPFGSVKGPSTTPAFSFAPFAAQKSTSVPIAESTFSSSMTESAEMPNATSSNNDTEFDSLLRQRSLNVCFQNVVKASLENDPFADLSILAKEYLSHKESQLKVPIEPAKNQSGTGIYPSFNGTNQESSSERDDKVAAEQVVPTPEPSAAKSSSGASFNVAAPAFAFKAPAEQTTGSAFKFGEHSSKPAQSTANTPTFSFGLSSKPDAELEEPSTAEPSSQPAEKKASDFSWTPDRGIKFGDALKSTEKPDAPVFGFNNPLTSPAPQKSAESEATTKPASSGFQFGKSYGTGFIFGQAFQNRDSSTVAKEPAESAPVSKPTFSFGSANPTFSFGQSTTPSFSFTAPKKPADTTDASMSVAEEKEDDNEEGDAMPEEPRTNDALIAGPAAGEEDEEEVYAIPRARLYKFKPEVEAGGNPWGDLGVCIIRVLVHKETKKARILARAEGHGAVRLNSRLYPHLNYTHEGKSNVKLIDLVSASETVTYLIKTKEKDVSKKLVDVLTENKK